MHRFGKSIAFLTAGLAVLLAGGCSGGGSGEDDRGTAIDTGGNGTLATVRVAPAPGSVFIPRVTPFQLAWTALQPPPPQFTVSLMRYREAIGGEDREIRGQSVRITRGTGFTWDIQRDSAEGLDASGVYFLQLNTPAGQEQLHAYIVSANRAAGSGSRAERIDSGSNGTLNGVTITPSPGAVFIPRRTTFQVSWPGANRPPAQFTIALRRYKERRGSESGSDAEQVINVARVGTGYAWTVKRRDDFDLDSGGVYYLEVAAAGENPVRAAYIVSGER